MATKTNAFPSCYNIAGRETDAQREILDVLDVQGPFGWTYVWSDHTMHIEVAVLSMYLYLFRDQNVVRVPQTAITSPQDIMHWVYANTARGGSNNKAGHYTVIVHLPDSAFVVVVDDNDQKVTKMRPEYMAAVRDVKSGHLFGATSATASRVLFPPKVLVVGTCNCNFAQPEIVELEIVEKKAAPATAATEEEGDNAPLRKRSRLRDGDGKKKDAPTAAEATENETIWV